MSSNRHDHEQTMLCPNKYSYPNSDILICQRNYWKFMITFGAIDSEEKRNTLEAISTNMGGTMKISD